jgi:UV DNA damage endonuclease
VTVENDDRGNLYSTTDLYNGIYKKIKIPIVFDYLHYECNPDETDMETTLKLAISTWPAGIKPAIHYSSSRKIEDESSIARSHADFVYEKINLYSNDIDIMLESKMFEQAVLDYRNSF